MLTMTMNINNTHAHT